MGLKIKKKKLLLTAAGLAFPFTLLLLVSCGQPSLTLFSAPSVSVNFSSVTITHSTDNEDLPNTQLYGYDLYYKLYIPGSQTITDDANYINSTTTNIPNASVLSTRKFLPAKMVRYNQEKNEFEDISRTPNLQMGNSVPTAVVDFSNSQTIKNESQAVVTLGNATTSFAFLHRNLNTGSASFFSDSYAASDYDVNLMVPGYTNTNELLVIFAVIPVGINIQNLQVLYGRMAVTNIGIRVKY